MPHCSPIKLRDNDNIDFTACEMKPAKEHEIFGTGDPGPNTCCHCYHCLDYCIWDGRGKETILLFFYFSNLQTYLEHTFLFSLTCSFPLSNKDLYQTIFYSVPLLPQSFVNRCNPGSMSTQGQRVSSIRGMCRKGQGLSTHPALMIAGE